MELLVNNLTFEYGHGKKVLDGVSFSAHSGDFISVIGRNGAGKSTLIKCLLNRFTNYSGTVLVDGIDTRTLSKKELSEYFAYVPQATKSVFDYSVMDMVLMGTVRGVDEFSAPAKKQMEIAMAALATMGIEHLADKNINRISGGEMQMVYIARALAQNARIILMDEPTSSLDFPNRDRVFHHVKQLAEQEYIIIMITHDPSVPLNYSNKVLAVKDGRVAGYGESEAVLTEELIYSVYEERIKLGTIDGHRVFYREL